MMSNPDERKLLTIDPAENQSQGRIVPETSNEISNTMKNKYRFLYYNNIGIRSSLEKMGKRNGIVQHFGFYNDSYGYLREKEQERDVKLRTSRKSFRLEKTLNLYLYKRSYKYFKEALYGLEIRKQLKQICFGLSGCHSIQRQSIRYFIQRLSSIKSLKDFKCSLRDLEISNQPVLFLSQGLKIHKSLQSIELSIGGKYPNDATLEIMFHQFKSLPSLKHLAMEFDYCESLTDEGIKYFVHGLSQLSSLQSLQVKFRFWKNITVRGLQCLIQGFKRLESLQSLSFGFQNWKNEISEEIYKDLKDTLSSLKKLTCLQLDFSFCKQFTDLGLEFLSQALKTMTQLRDVELNFSCISGITADGVKKLSQSFKLLTSLKSLTLNFYRCNGLTNATLQSLSEGLEKCLSLQSFELEFDTGNIFDCRGQSLNDSLKNLPLLQTCSLYLNQIRFIDFDPLNMNHGLISLTKITNLELYFSSDEPIDDLKLSCLNRGFQSLQLLKTLRLYFPDCSEISDQGLADLGQGLKHLNSLQELSFSLKECQKVTDIGFQSLSQGIEALGSLQDLHLELSYLNISDSGFQYLTKALTNLLSLHSLSFIFYRLTNLSNLQLESSNPVQMFPKSLKQIRMYFSAFDLKNRALDFLTQGIRALHLLKNLDVDIYETTITESRFNEFKQDLSSGSIKKSSFSFTPPASE